MDSNQQNILETRLSQKGWLEKLSLYSPDFESVEIINEKLETQISVILISWKFNDDIVKNLSVLTNEKGIKKQIVFVDNGSNKGEMDSVRPFVDILVRLNRNTGAYLARNVGAVFCDAPVLAFIDDDAIPEKNLLKEHLKAHSTYDVVSVRGVVRPKTENPLNNMAGHYYLGPNPFPVFSDIEGNVSYQSKMFFECKGWDDGIIFGGGGIEFSRRMIEYEPDMRKQIYFPDAVIYHDYAVNENHIIAKKEKQQKSKERLRKKFPDIDLYIQQWNKTFRRTDLLIKKSVSNGKEIQSESSTTNYTDVLLMPGEIRDIKKTLYGLFRREKKPEKIILSCKSDNEKMDLERLLKRQNMKYEFYVEGSEGDFINQMEPNSIETIEPDNH